MKNLKFVFLYLFILFGFVSCNNLLSAKKTGNIKLELPEINDIYRNSDNDNDPHFEDPLNINFKITVESPENNYKYSKEIKQKDTLTIVDLAPGEYKIFVEYNSKLNSFAGYQTVTVVPGEIAETTIYLEDKIPTYIDDVKYVVDNEESVLKFTITTKTEWSIPHLFNENYDIAMCAPECSKTNEYTYYFPFCENGKRYVFTLGKDDGDGWKSTKFAVTYNGQDTEYSINTDLIEYYNNYFTTKINLVDKNNYKLSISGIPTDPEKNIFNDTITIDSNSYYLNYQLWSGDENNLSWIAENSMELKNAMNNPNLTEFINYNYDDIKNNKENQIWTYIFFDIDEFNQRFRLLDKFSNSFELIEPENDESEHFKAEYDEHGIKVTIKHLDSNKYATDAGQMRVCDFEKHFYSVILNKETIDSINEGQDFNFIWPFSNEGDEINLELQYFLQSDENRDCLKENVTVKSGKGKYYDEIDDIYDIYDIYKEKDITNFNLFTIENDKQGINSRVIKSKLSFEEFKEKLPDNAENIHAEFVIEGTNSEYAWNWDDRKWIVSFGGEFPNINKYFDETTQKINVGSILIDDSVDYNIKTILKLFTDEGLDITDILSEKNWEELANYEYIIPTIDISFTMNDDDISKYVKYSTVFQCGDVNKETLKVLDETNSYAINYHFGNMVYTERVGLEKVKTLPENLNYFENYNWYIANNLEFENWLASDKKVVKQIYSNKNEIIDVYLQYVPLMSNWNGNGEEGAVENDFYTHVPAKLFLSEDTTNTIQNFITNNKKFYLKMTANINKTPDITKINSIGLNILEKAYSSVDFIDLSGDQLTVCFTVVPNIDYSSEDGINLDLIYMDDFCSESIKFSNWNVEVLDETNS